MPWTSACLCVSHADRPAWLQQVTAVPENTVTVIASPDEETGQLGSSSTLTPHSVLQTQQDLIDSKNISLNRVTLQVLPKVLNGFIDPMPQVFSTEANYGWARPDIPSTYTVQSGDTLSEISEQFDVSTEYLARINDIADPDLIISGRELTIKTSDNYWRQRLLDREPLYWNEESPENRPLRNFSGCGA